MERSDTIMQLPRKEAVKLRSANPQVYDLVMKQLADELEAAFRNSRWNNIDNIIKFLRGE
jgi:hypothetical protein